MRVIEEKMVQAIRNKTDWKSANTEVRHYTDGGNEYADIFLHGHHIATACPVLEELAGNSDGRAHQTLAYVRPNRNTFLEWPTRTTRSRLCALGVNASIKDFEPCIDGKAL